MKHLHRWFIVVILLMAGTNLSAEVRLPAVFQNHMVLQRDMAIKVWGWADPGERVTVELGKNSARTKADETGVWRLTLPAMTAGGPHSMVVKGKNELTVENILVGEVWICSGQSNMEWSMRVIDHNTEEILNADYPEIRLFHVPRRAASHPQDDVDATWRSCNATSIVNFSAVAYFFGRMLHRELGVPIGLIATSWGGTRIEPWTPVSGFEQVPELGEIVGSIESADARHRQALDSSLQEIGAWLEEALEVHAQGQPLPDMPRLAPHPLAGRQDPTALYNGQIHPLVPLAFRGAIWYQGESNLRDGLAYEAKMRALISGWRQIWGQGDFPFYYVQLAPYTYTFTAESGAAAHLPFLREAQRKALTIPNTGMVVTTDIGNFHNIHPTNKQEVGRRLALWALAKTYNQSDIVYSGPLYRSMSRVDSRIRVQFDHAEGLSSRRGGPLNWFEIAGADGKFVRANALIRGQEVEVWSPQVENPRSVRLGWHEEAVPNLVNGAGLPASPFSSDHD